MSDYSKRLIEISRALLKITSDDQFSQEALDQVIGLLGDLRAMMKPEFPTTWDSMEPFHVQRPNWSTQSGQFGEIVVHVRDPRFGWMHYAIEKEAALELGERLIEKARSAPTAGRA